MTALPARPLEHEDPWFAKRDAWDAAVEAEIEGRLSEPEIQKRYVGRGSSTARDTVFGVPGTDTARAALANLRPGWFNTDYGWLESYYAPAGTAGLTAPGLVAGTAAGWYPSGLGPEINLTPSANQSVAAGAAFTSWNAPGTSTSWRRGGAAWMTYAGGAITAVKAGRYELFCTLIYPSGTTGVAAYLILNGSTSTVITQNGMAMVSGVGTMLQLRSADVALAANDNVRFHYAQGATVGIGGAGRGAGEFTVRYIGPNLASV